MKKLLLISMLVGVLPLSMQAQDDDLYFVPKKSQKAGQVTDNYGVPRDTYYSGSNRSVDEYNRRDRSSYVVIDGDSTKADVIEFSAVQGVYPDSAATDDYQLTRQLERFDDYDLSDNEAFWRGYRVGSSTWGWHSPWYYGRYGWYGGWYDPWYYGSWYGGWYDPWYYGYYGWYDPWYYGYYGWGYPYRYYGYWGYPYYYGGGSGHYYGHTGNAGTIRRDGSTRGYAGWNNRVAGNGQRMSSLRDRAGYTGRYNSGNSQRSGSGNFSGRRGSSTTTYNNSNSSFGSSRSSGSFGGGGATRSSGGGFSGGGSRGGGGHMGGRR